MTDEIKSVYSPSENVIYPSSLYAGYVAAGTWPDDGILVSDEDAAAFSGGNKPTGKMLGMENGSLVWIDEPIQPSQLIADADNMKATLKANADEAISWRQDAVDTGIATRDEKAALDAWKKFRVLLMRIDTSTAPEIEWPEVPGVA